MTYSLMTIHTLRLAALLAAMVPAILATGCSKHNDANSFAEIQPLPANASYNLLVDLDPASHVLRGNGSIILPGAADEVSFRLHEKATLVNIEARGARIKEVRTEAPTVDGETHSTYTLLLNPEVARPELLITWEGVFYQDPSLGEAAGEIHNHTVRATVSPEGVYLTGGWYPQLVGSSVADYQLSLGRPENLVLVASGEKDDTASETAGRDIWHSAYPLQDLVIVGGPHEVHTDEWHGLKIAVHLKPSQAEHAEGLKDSVRRYLDRYEPLLGPLPTTQYRVVDNFFSSGFAFPGFTLLSSSVIEMGEVSQTHHGYIDHEFVHTWFGVGIFADDRQGNWSESLTSYATNYYGYILDGDQTGARKYRRDSSNSFSKLPPEQDVALDQFGQRPDVSRSIGYNKGAVIFHILEQEIGAETFWSAIRTFNYRNVGKAAAWSDLQLAFENASGQDLEWFFQQWVHGAGGLEAKIAEATWDNSTKKLRLTLDKPSNFRVKLPITVKSSNADQEVIADLQVGQSEIIVDTIASAPNRVVLDPDYHLLRKLSLQELVPTIDSTRRSKKIIALVDESEIAEATPFLELFNQPSAAGQFRQGADISGVEFRRLEDLSRTDLEWSDSAVVIFGKASRTPAGQAILSKIDSPLRLLPTGFAVGEKQFTATGEAVSATLRHPTLHGSGVTVILGNSVDSLPRATILPFFPNSIVVFSNKRSSLKEDLEFDSSVAVRNLQQ